MKDSYIKRIKRPTRDAKKKNVKENSKKNGKNGKKRNFEKKEF